MKNEVLLTIGIPTYNRYSYLKDLLQEVIFQINELENIEILISDNASTDETFNYLEKIDKSKISYYRNNVNIGADANFIECIKKSKGEYIWLFGDDDLLLKDGIKNVMKIISSEKPDLIILKEKNYNNNIVKSKYLNYNEIIKEIEKKNPHFLLAHTLITMNVFKKDIFDIDYAKAMLKTNYSHMYGLIKNLNEQNKVFITKKSIIEVRVNRAKFSEVPKNLIKKQSEYIFYLGKKYKNKKLIWFAYLFFIKEIFKKLNNNLKKEIKKYFFK